MSRGPLLLLCLALSPLFAASVQLYPALPNAAVTNALQLDSAGNIYLAGEFAPASFIDTANAFVAKLSPDGSKLLYFTVLAGSGPDLATGLAVAPDGSAYVAGDTSSFDFPVTPGSYRQASPVGGLAQGFVAKVDPSGAIVYSTFVNGPNLTDLTGLALDAAGNVFVTGLGGPSASINVSPQGFLLKLDPALSKPLLDIYGWGGGLVQLDPQGNIYLAGSAQANVTFPNGAESLALPPLTPGGFQPNHPSRFCFTFGSGPGGVGGQVSCSYQYVARLSPTGTPVWATYVTGTYGATAHGMAVDSAGNVIVAGSTYSDDYPVTSGAFQPAYAAAAPPFPTTTVGFSAPPPFTGYVTKVNSTGTALLWSTYFGGSFTDQITGLAVSPSGNILVSGRASSTDLPAVAGTPDACRPTPNQPLGFIASLTLDGAAAGPTQLLTSAPDCAFLTCPQTLDFPRIQTSWPVALRKDGSVVVAGTSGTVASIDFHSTPRVACILDPADFVQLRSVAPGELVSIFGIDLGAGASVGFNGIAAPVLYSAAQQANVQVPYEIAPQTAVQLQIANAAPPLPLSETHSLGVATRQPAIFLAPTALQSAFPWYSQCGGATDLGEAALALNADGTVNSCANPALGGSTVTLFLNGLGPVTPALATGATSAAPPVALSPGVQATGFNVAPLAIATNTSPGSISGVAQVQVQLPLVAGPAQPVAISPTVSGVPLRERLVLVWVRAP